MKKLFLKFLKYVSLNVIGMMGISVYILADTFFISDKLGALGLTALNIAIPIYNLVFGVALMLGMGGATIYAIYKSRGEKEKANGIFTYTAIITVLISLVFMLTGILFSDDITRLLGASQAVYSMTNIYIKVVLLFSPAFIFNQIFICFLRNDGAPRLAMLSMLAGSLFNILFDYIFIFPLDMGIFGAVLATGISPVVGMLVMSYHKLERKNSFHFARVKLKIKECLKIVSTGTSAFINEVSVGIVMAVLNLLILNINGDIGVASYGVIANISIVVISVFNGIAQGSQPLFSRFFGENNKKDLNKVLIWSVFSTVLSAVAIYLIVFLLNAPIVKVFNSEGSAVLQRLSETGMLLYFTSALFSGMNILLSTFFAAVERPVPAQIISLLRGIILTLPVAVIMSMLFKMNGIWLTYTVSEGIVLLIALFFIKKRP